MDDGHGKLPCARPSVHPAKWSVALNIKYNTDTIHQDLFLDFLQPMEEDEEQDGAQPMEVEEHRNTETEEPTDTEVGRE